jgi:hypothetical protein
MGLGMSIISEASFHSGTIVEERSRIPMHFIRGCSRMPTIRFQTSRRGSGAG